MPGKWGGGSKEYKTGGVMILDSRRVDLRTRAGVRRPFFPILKCLSFRVGVFHSLPSNNRFMCAWARGLRSQGGGAAVLSFPSFPPVVFSFRKNRSFTVGEWRFQRR